MQNWIITLVVALLAAPSAKAATLNVDGTGQLLGASGVDVGGTLYDVQFLDGTCIDLYNGCDDVSDFTFATFFTSAEATLASQALLDQVFLDGADLFDSDPTLTNGCFGPTVNECLVSTIYGSSTNQFISPNYRAFAVSAFNSSVELGSGGDQLVFASFLADVNLASLNEQTYAVWSATPVPEPSTALLLGLGLTGLAAKGRRRNRS